MFNCLAGVRALLPLLLLCPAILSAQAAPVPLTIGDLGSATVKLDGPWQFHPGDNPVWAQPAVDDSAWEQLSVDKSWGEQTHFNYTGYGWYRKHLRFDAATSAQPDLTLLLPRVQDVAEVYWNGVLIGRIGTMPPHPSWKLGLWRKTVPLSAPQDGVLAIRVWKSPYFSGDAGNAGGLSDTPLVGSAQGIGEYKAARDYRNVLGLRWPAFFWTLTLAMGVIGLLGWLQNRHRKVLFWMSMWSIASLGGTMLMGMGIPWTATIAVTLDQPIFGVMDVSVWFLLLYLLELDQNVVLTRWVRRLACFGVALQCIDGIAVALAWNGVDVLACQFADFAVTMFYNCLEPLPLVLIGFAIHKKLGVARWLVAGLGAATELTVAVRNALSQGQRFTHWTIADKLSGLQSAETGLLFGAIIYAVWKYSTAQSTRHTSLEQEFKSAQELQRVLIPDELPPLPGFAITSAYRPAQEVGGDFFQVIMNADGTAIIVLGDVSGKGLKAAMTVAMIVGAVRALIENNRDPAKILEGLNRRLVNRLQHGFATCIILRFDPGGRCIIANAGHLSPFLNDRELDLPGALPLGLDEDARYENTPAILAVGDRLTLYTDGLLEARAHNGELFGFDRVRTLMTSKPDATQAVDAAVAFGQDDDITVLSLVRLAGGVKSTTTLSAPVLAAAGVA